MAADNYSSNRLHDILRIKAASQFNFEAQTTKQQVLENTAPFWANRVSGSQPIRAVKTATGARPLIAGVVNKNLKDNKNSKPPICVQSSAWASSNRCQSAAVNKRPQSSSTQMFGLSQNKGDGVSNYQTSYHPSNSTTDENLNFQNSHYRSMCSGSKAINDQKLKDESNLTEKLKDDLFKKYGSDTEKISMVDFYIQRQSKNTYVTEGTQRFESNLINSLQKIQLKQQQQSGHGTRLSQNDGSYYSHTSQPSSSRSINKLSNGLLMESSKATHTSEIKVKQQKTTKLYYNGIPKTLLKQGEPSQDKDKLNYAKAKWLQKRGVDILQMDRNSEDESRQLFKYIDFENSGKINRQLIRLFISFMEGEFSQNDVNLQNPLLIQLNKITKIVTDDSTISEDNFTQLMTRVNVSQKPRTAVPGSRCSQQNKDSVGFSTHTSGFFPMKDDKELVNIQDNLKRSKHLRIKLDELKRKIQKRLTQMEVTQQHENNSPLSKLNKFRSDLENFQSQSIPLKEHEFSDLNVLFRKLTGQLDRFESHYTSNLSSSKTSASDLEQLSLKLHDFDKRLCQVQNHQTQQQAKITGEAVQEVDDEQYKQLKTLNSALKRRAVMNKMERNTLQTSLQLNQKSSEKFDWTEKIKQIESKKITPINGSLNRAARTNSLVQMKFDQPVTEVDESDVSITSHESAESVESITIIRKKPLQIQHPAVNTSQVIQNGAQPPLLQDLDSQFVRMDNAIAHQKSEFQRDLQRHQRFKHLRGNIPDDQTYEIQQPVQQVSSSLRYNWQQPKEENKITKTINSYQLISQTELPDNDPLCRGDLIVFHASSMTNNQTFNVQKFSHPTFKTTGINKMEIVNNRLLIQGNDNQVFYLRSLDKDKEIMTVKIPKQSAQVLTVALNDDQILISSNNGQLLSLQDDNLLKVPGTPKEFQSLSGNSGSYFVGITSSPGQEIYHISNLNGNMMQRSPYLTFDRISFGTGITITQVSCGADHAIALDRESQAYTWGNNSCGQLGHGNYQDITQPKQLSYHMDVTHIAAYGNSTALVDNLNNLLTFGSNSHGQLGIDQAIKPRSFDNCYPTFQKANSSLILAQITELHGSENTFGFLTKQHEIYICGDFRIAIEDGKIQEVNKKTFYQQKLLKPTLAKFLGRFKIQKFALTESSVAIISQTEGSPIRKR